MRTLPSLIVAWALGVACAHAQSLTIAERPDVAPGDWWQYEITTYPSESTRRFRLTVDEVTADTIAASTRNTATVYDRDWGVREMKRGGEVSYRGAPPRPLLRFPLQPDKTWDGRAMGHYPDFTRRWQGRVRVTGTEPITVPAGIFQTFVVKYEGYYPTARGDSMYWRETVWYAPQARRWVKRDWTWDVTYTGAQRMTERQVEQLIAYGREGQKPAGEAAARAPD